MTLPKEGARGADESASAPGWRDEPISSLRQDRLGRAHFAQHAARLISANHSAESSVVYGLEGPWGSGKTSVIALVATCLAEDTEASWRVVHFTPWATTGTEALLAEFFAALSAAAPDVEGEMQLRARIANYADIARPVVALIPGIGVGVAEAARTLQERLKKPWNLAFAEVAAEVRRLETPILVVVDDIDRLQPTELLDLLKVVRLLGRFPGVDFLLAYDAETLVETLQDPSRGLVSTARARAFMEKIVQYPLSMPPLLTGKIVRMLDSGLTAILTAERIEAGFESDRFSRIVLQTMPSELMTPRAIERFLAQVREQFRVHDRDEINDVDLVLATFLRVQFPDLFAQLQHWKRDLTRRPPRQVSLAVHEDPAPDWASLLGLVEDGRRRRSAREVMEVLFPAVGDRYAGRPVAGRMAHPDYFDRYLAQTIPEGDIPDSVVARALELASTGDDRELRSLVAAEDDEQVLLALSKIGSRYADPGEPWAGGGGPDGPVTGELLAAGMRLVGEMKDRKESLSSGLSLVTHWCKTLLRQVINNDPAAGVDGALAQCTNAHRRALVIARAAASLDNLRPEVSQALRDVVAREVGRAVPLLIDDLRLGDESDSDIGSPFMYGLAAEAGFLPELRAAIEQGLKESEFSLADVAARFVSFAYAWGASETPSSAAFVGVLFTRYTGVDADSTEHDDDVGGPVSWALRREVATRYVAILRQ